MHLVASVVLGRLCSSAIRSIHDKLIQLRCNVLHRQVTNRIHHCHHCHHCHFPFCHLRIDLKAQPVVHASAGCSQLDFGQCWTEDVANLGPEVKLRISFAIYGQYVDADHADGGC